jgi:vacuolar-type H+-ATPase subunit H
MSLEAIKTISEAEEAVHRRKAEAQQEARRAIAEAQAAADAAVDAAKAKAADELQGLAKTADDKSRADALELAGNTENKKAAMRVHAESRLDAAARFITERIVNS